MAADLHIHVFEDGELTDEHFRIFFANSLGSKWCSIGAYKNVSWDDPRQKKVRDTPNEWIGSVSWLKAALFADGEKYVPNTVAQVSEIIDEHLPTIDDELIEKIRAAFDSTNKTGYELAEVNDVVKFLTEHKGKKAFTISW